MVMTILQVISEPSSLPTNVKPIGVWAEGNNEAYPRLFVIINAKYFLLLF